MQTLVGLVYPNGHIEFPRERNPWAFRRIDRELKSGQEDRIRFDPELAPVELTLSDAFGSEDCTWYARAQSLLQTADTIYLQQRKDTLRFRRAVHQVKGSDQQLITLGTQEEVDQFAAEHWSRLRRFFALRHDGFHFDVTMVVTAKRSDPPKADRIDVRAHLTGGAKEELPHISFLATGSHADIHIIEWRSSVPEGDTGRFEHDGSDITLHLENVLQPVTFLYEYRHEFHNRAFIFMDPKVDARLKRIFRRERV